MTRPEDMITDALRSIAGQAATPRRTADALWQAGRRRRRVMAISAAGAALAVTAAVAVPLAVAGRPADSHPSPRPGLSQPAPAGPVQLRSPIEFRQVASIGSGPCAAGSGGLPGGSARLGGKLSGGNACFHLTGAGMTITAIQAAHVRAQSSTGGYVLSISLAPADRRPFEALTRKLAGLPGPRDQLAIILDGHVIVHPAVVTAMPGGQVEISGFTSRAFAESLLRFR